MSVCLSSLKPTVRTPPSVDMNINKGSDNWNSFVVTLPAILLRSILNLVKVSILSAIFQNKRRIVTYQRRCLREILAYIDKNMVTTMTQLLMANALLLGLTTRATSAGSWGRRTISAIRLKNPWQIYDVTRHHDDQLSSSGRILLEQQHIASIRGGSSATGKYFLYVVSCCPIFGDCEH
jgi:hypothetical protein